MKNINIRMIVTAQDVRLLKKALNYYYNNKASKNEKLHIENYIWLINCVVEERAKKKGKKMKRLKLKDEVKFIQLEDFGLKFDGILYTWQGGDGYVSVSKKKRYVLAFAKENAVYDDYLIKLYELIVAGLIEVAEV